MTAKHGPPRSVGYGSSSVKPWFLDPFAWCFALVIAGYPSVAVVSLLLGIEGNSASISLRLAIIGLAFVSALSAKQYSMTLSRVGLFIFFLIVIYLCRLVSDIYDGSTTALPALIYLTGTALVPAILLWGAAGSTNERNVTLTMLVVGGVTSALGLYAAVVNIGGVQSSWDGVRVEYENLNPIVLGHSGVSAFIPALLVVVSKERTFVRIFAAAVGFLALCLVYFAGSRGPLMALGACLVIYVWTQRRWGGALALTYLAILAFAAFNPQEVDRLLEAFRLDDLGQDTSSVARLFAIEQAIQQFLDDPLFGGAFDLPGGNYPHNFFIEIAMSLGVVGLLTIALATIRVASAFFLLIRTRYIIIPLLFTQYIVAQQFSFSLWGASQIWVLIGLVPVVAAGLATFTVVHKQGTLIAYGDRRIK